MPVKVGLSQQPFPPLQLIAASAQQAEADGFDSLWYPDHLMGWFPRSLWTTENSSIVNLIPSPHTYLDPTIVIALIGQVTSKIMLGTGVTDPIRRPPAELARTFLTLSHATAGRSVLGIGAGERENTQPYGLDFSKQVSRLEEALHIIRLLWESDDYVDFEGRFWKLRRAVLDTPAYEGKFPPIWIGAHGPRMLEITGRYADGWYPSYPMTPDEYAEKLAVIRKAAGAAGRNPNAIVAGQQVYAVIADDHETSHQIMNGGLARAMTLVAPSSQWERSGRKHPFGAGFEGLRDYVPEWYSKEELDAALAQFDLEVLHDTVPHGTADEVIEQLEPLIESGLEHLVLASLAVLAGVEFIETARAGAVEIAKRLR